MQQTLLHVTGTGDDYQNIADKRTIQGIETTFANFSGEGTRTNHYVEGFIEVESSTSTREVICDDIGAEGTEIQLD